MTSPLRLARVRDRLPAWLVLAAAFALVFSRLRTPEAVLPLLRPWAEVGALACGMTAVMLTGGIDLSVGSIVGLSGVVLAYLWKTHEFSMVWASAGAVGVGLLAGCLNGWLVILGVAPLVATLATMAAYSGLAMAISAGERAAGFPTEFLSLGQGDRFGLPNQFHFLAATACLTAIAVHCNRFGRCLYMIGENRRAADFAAVPTRRVEFGLYALNGFLAGLTALWYTARRGAAAADAGTGLELQVIACVVLGGTSVAGGLGSVGRTLLGLAALAHLEIGLRLWGNLKLAVPGVGAIISLNANVRLILIGFLLVAVAIMNERAAGRYQENR